MDPTHLLRNTELMNVGNNCSDYGVVKSGVPSQQITKYIKHIFFKLKGISLGFGNNKKVATTS